MLREDFIFYVILLRINILLLRGGGVPILAEFIGLQITDCNHPELGWTRCVLQPINYKKK